MTETEKRERLRRARLELEPLVKGDYRLNGVLNTLTKLEAEGATFHGAMRHQGERHDGQ